MQIFIDFILKYMYVKELIKMWHVIHDMGKINK